MAVRLNQEAGGFKLLEEDAMDDRPPCAAVTKFVTSVLDRKDMKDQEVANSFRNLMEYRDWNSSPSACSVATSSSALDGDRMNSPPSPSSPPAIQASRNDQRLPNELLDEICEDIGMKEDMELDFVEFLMEQDTNPHAYMTQEAISSSGAYNSAAGSTISTPTGSGSGMGSGSGSNSGSAAGSQQSNVTNNNNININNNNDNSKSFTPLGPPSSTTPNFLFKPNFGSDSDWINQLPSPIVNSSGQSSSTTTVASSENNSPAQKRLHLSASAETSPSKGRSQTPPGLSRPKTQSSSNGITSSAMVPSSPQSNISQSMFKMPQSGPLMAKRSHSYPQGVPACSPVHSTHSSDSQGSTTSSCHSNYASGGMRPSEFSSKPLSSSSGPSGEMGDLGNTLSSSMPVTSINNNNNECKKESCISPIAIVPPASCDYAKPGSPPDNQPSFQGMTMQVGSRDSSVFQRVEKQLPPPNVSVKSMQQHQQQQNHQQHHQHQRWMAPLSQQGPHMGGPQPSYFNKGGYPTGPFPAHHRPMTQMPVGPPGTQTVRTPVESPLDQGYFSNESAGNCSNGSAPSPAFSSSMSSFSSSSTLMPADHHHLHHRSHPLPNVHQHSQSQQTQAQQPPQQPSAQQQHQIGSQKSPQQDNSELSNVKPAGQKSVRFSNMPEGSPPGYQPRSVEGQGYNMAPSSSTPQSDCAFEGMDTNGQKGVQSGKILPRINPCMKSGVAPYTVPNNHGQILPPGSQGYEFADRPSCAMSGGQETSNEEMNSYMGKQVPPGVSGSASYYVDGNRNMMPIESIPEYSGNHPHHHHHHPSHQMQPRPSGEYSMPPDQQGPYHMDHFSSMQQHHHHPHPPQQQQQQQQQNKCSEPMHPQHPHMQPPIAPQPPMHQGDQQQHQQAPQQFSSCSHSSQAMNSDFRPMHANNMQISSGQSNYQMPLAMSTPMPNRPGSNPRLMSAGPQMGQGYPTMCPPAYDSSFSQGHRPEAMYPQGQPQPPAPPPSHPGQPPIPGQSVHRGWGTGAEELHVQVPPSPMKAGMPTTHQGLPHMQPSPTPACAAPMGPSPHIQDPAMLNSGVPNMTSGGMGPHLNSHPDYGPCAGMNCDTCKMGPNGALPPPPLSHSHPHLGPCGAPSCHMCKIQHHPHHHHQQHHQAMPSSGQAIPHVGPCAGPNCTACKLNQVNRPPILSSQQKFLQHLIMDEGNSAYRSHPLFPLLRDLVIAEANFDNPQFHYQQLLSTLPNDLQKLLQNFLHRNRPSGHYQSNQAVESVIMDGLRLAHSNLVDKIRQRQEMEKMKGGSVSLRSMEEFCQKFDHSITGPMVRGGVPNGMGTLNMGHPMGGYHHDGSYIQPGIGPMSFRPLKDGHDLLGDANLAAANPQANKTESKKHPSLPKEAVAMMMEWLRNHKDNPYPNDDEKAMLIKQTGLSINQINYWFTNARRRILPKWAQCKT